MTSFKRWLSGAMAAFMLFSPIGFSGAQAQSEIQFYQAQIDIIDENLSAMIDELSLFTMPEKTAAKSLVRMFLHGESIEKAENLQGANLLLQKMIDMVPAEDFEANFNKAQVSQLVAEMWLPQNKDLRKRFFTAFFAMLHDGIEAIGNNLNEISSLMEDEMGYGDFQVFFKHYMKMYDALMVLYGKTIFEADIENLPPNYDPILQILDVVDVFLQRSNTNIPAEIKATLKQAKAEYKPDTYESFFEAFSNGFNTRFTDNLEMFNGFEPPMSDGEDVDAYEWEAEAPAAERYYDINYTDTPVLAPNISSEPEVYSNPKQNRNASIRARLKQRRAIQAQ